MADLLELTADIVCAHASVTEMSPDELLNELKAIHATLQALEKGEKPPREPGKLGEKMAAARAARKTKADPATIMHS